jgi:hypothetical protein
LIETSGCILDPKGSQPNWSVAFKYYCSRCADSKLGAFSGILRKSPDGFIASLKEEIEDLRKKRDGLTPQWWREAATK